MRRWTPRTPSTRTSKRVFGLALLCAALPAFADGEKWGSYTPNLDFKVVDTDKGDMSVSIYT